MSNSVEITHKELRQMLNKTWETKISMNISGTTGIGKSVAVLEFAKAAAQMENREFIEWNKISKAGKKNVMQNPEKYFIFMDIRLSQYDSTDLKGLPKIDSEDVVEWLIQNWLFCLTNPTVKALVFFDEFNLAPPSVQASAYQIIRDKCLGDVKLGDDVLIISAGNTLDDRANVFDMAKPLCNRFIHTTLLPPDAESWTEWALKNNIDDRIIAYLQFKPDHLFNFQPDSPENAFATHRSWSEFVSPLINGLSHKDKMFQKYVASAVGTGVAVEFTAFNNLKDTIDFKAILNNPKEIESITQIDLQFSLVSIITEWLKNNHGKAGMDKLLDMLQYMQPEYAILVLKIAVERYLSQVRKHFHANKLWKDHLAEEYTKYLK